MDDELPPIPLSEEEAQLTDSWVRPAGPPLRNVPRISIETIRKRQRQREFLEAFRACGVVRQAAREVGVSSNLVHSWWRKDPAFEAAFRDAERDAADVIEEEMFRRGVRGWQEPVVHQGMPTMLENPETGEQEMFTLTRYSEGCLLALAKARRPDRFRDNHRVEHAGSVVTGVLVVPAAVDAESWEKAAAEQQARFRPSDGPKTIEHEP